VFSLNLANKKDLVADMHELLGKSQIVFTVDYKGLNVSDVSALRAELRKADVEMKVVKNTLLKRASEDTDYSILNDYYKGPTAVVMSYDDQVAPAKILTNFAKDNPKLEITAAAMNGKVINEAEIKALSSLPSREVLLSQVLNVMNAVPTSFVRVLNAVPNGFVNVLSNIKDEKEKEAA